LNPIDPSNRQKPVRTLNDYLLIALRGAGMGAADVVPGVSGGTVAFITGIYAELLATISGLKFSLIAALRQEGIAAVWRRANLNFLLALLSGIAIAVVGLANAVSYLLETQEQLLWGFFFGLVTASVYAVGKTVTRWNFSTVMAFVLGTAIALLITALKPLSSFGFSGFIFIAGMIAICAMILPGISGSFLLLILGAYEDVIQAVKTVDLATIAEFGAGCIVGLLGFSRGLNWLYNTHKALTVSLLTGFMLGSLQKLWPWQHKVTLLHVHSNGKEDWLRANVLPTAVEGDAQLVPVLACALGGALLILAIDWLANRNEA
jgi:putative membrane protein